MSAAIEIFKQGGFAMVPIALIVLVLCGLILRTSWLLVRNGRSQTAAIQSGLDGLLFWGGFAVITGIIGSAIGYHKGMAAIAAHGVVNPRALWIGSAEGLMSSIAGMCVLALAGAAWYPLRMLFVRSRSARR